MNMSSCVALLYAAKLILEKESERFKKSNRENLFPTLTSIEAEAVSGGRHSKKQFLLKKIGALTSGSGLLACVEYGEAFCFTLAVPI